MSPRDWEFDNAEPPDLYDVLFYSDSGLLDPHAQELMIQALVAQDGDAYADLCEYLWEEYDIDFEADFDWDGFKEWYDGR